ncbi:MAG: AI-2E family transporter [Cyclobacteriaceae bacterium]|nr:AI-2E family transporter [Cyclobacteriaceae bacterium]
MNQQARQIIIFTTLIILGLTFLFYAIIKAKPFLMPISLAALLAMILLPVEKKLRQWKFSKSLSILVSDLLLLGFCVGIFLVVGAQVQSISEQWPEYEEKLGNTIEQVQEFVENKTGISQEKQITKFRDAFSSQSEGSIEGETVKTVFPKLISFSGNFILVFIYIFFFMYYRQKFKNTILKFIDDDKREQASGILINISKVSQQYLFGRFLLIVFLAILYTIGLSIVGIKHALLVSFLAAILSLIPYIGNVFGIVLALFMSLLTDGTFGTIIGVLIVFTIAQFFESYILEPFVVGKQVELNPVVTLIGVVAGGYVWGIAGMVIAIPVMGIFKVIFDNIPVMKPLGYALDEEDAGEGEGWFEKMKDRVVARFKK